jgi:hypothetical protein
MTHSLVNSHYPRPLLPMIPRPFLARFFNAHSQACLRYPPVSPLVEALS